MASSINRVLKGHKASYRLLEVLKEPSVFKASIVSSVDSSHAAAIDTRSYVHVFIFSSFVNQTINNSCSLVVKDLLMERELRAHQLPVIKECPYIRQAVDVIEKGEQEDWSSSQSTINKRIVLEWMETNLWHVRPFDKPFSNPKLPQIVARSILEALLVFQRMKGVHTGRYSSSHCSFSYCIFY
jgi:hypothetical protein